MVEMRREARPSEPENLVEAPRDRPQGDGEQQRSDEPTEQRWSPGPGRQARCPIAYRGQRGKRVVELTRPVELPGIDIVEQRFARRVEPRIDLAEQPRLRRHD